MSIMTANNARIETALSRENSVSKAIADTARNGGSLVHLSLTAPEAEVLRNLGYDVTLPPQSARHNGVDDYIVSWSK